MLLANTCSFGTIIAA
ncbi:hypothetical protein ACFP58_09520 [Psychrobacter glacincola]|uniref:Uncharacterized protein n=1 Tax=Psychrobacter glacincola TaxID=56810 RepID=A0ABW1W9H0_9GAMM